MPGVVQMSAVTMTTTLSPSQLPTGVAVGRRSPLEEGVSLRKGGGSDDS